MDYKALGLLFVLSISSTIYQADSLSPPLFLTPFITSNKTEDARRLSEVKSSLFLNVSSHSGFLTIDPSYNSNTFFWYFPVAGKPVNETPWIVWLQGGPGASSLVGVFDEIGPFEYEHEKGLKLRNNSWTKEYSMLFIDNPVGAGYSFTDHDEGYARNMTMYTANLYMALQQLVLIFPELRKAPLFIAGESYAGRYATALAANILDHGLLLDVQLEGIILGNPVLNHADIANYSAVFHQWGLIDTQGVAATKTLQDQYLDAVKAGNSSAAYQLREDLLNQLQTLTRKKQLYNALVDDYQLSGFEEFLTSEEIMEALHVGNRSFVFDSDKVKKMLVPDFLNDMQPEVEKLLDHYRVLIYCGQLDLTSPCVPSAEARRGAWQWSLRNEFQLAPRVPWWHNETLAGFVKSGGGLTEALVIGAGHLVPLDKPDQAQQLVSSFINEKNEGATPQDKNKQITTNSTISPIANVTSTTLKPQTVVTTIAPQANKSITNETSAQTTNENTTLPTKQTENNTTQTPSVTPTTTPIPPSSVTTNKNTVSSSTENPVKTQDNKNTKISLPNSSAIKTEATPTSEGMSSGAVFSIILNVLLVVILALFGGLYYYRQRRRAAEIFYSNVETNSDDIFLS